MRCIEWCFNQSQTYQKLKKNHLNWLHVLFQNYMEIAFHYIFILISFTPPFFSSYPSQKPWWRQFRGGGVVGRNECLKIYCEPTNENVQFANFSIPPPLLHTLISIRSFYPALKNEPALDDYCHYFSLALNLIIMLFLHLCVIHFWNKILDTKYTDDVFFERMELFPLTEFHASKLRNMIHYEWAK